MDSPTRSALDIRIVEGYPVLQMNDKPLFYFGGEVEYYRIPRADWRDRLIKARDCGLGFISTYIPWNWHEHEEGRFDFDGESHPSRDLEAFLRICEELSLSVVARPGPWICNEWKYGGIPSWFLKDHWPEAASLTSDDTPITGEFKTGKHSTDSYPAICYTHPAYVEHVRRWYAAVSGVLRRHLASVGGCVVAVAVDNETSFTFNQGAFDSDYNTVVVEEYRKRCGVQPPRRWPAPLPQNREGLAAVHRWIRFKDSYLAEYLGWLKGLVEENGLEGVPVVSNDAVRRFRYFPAINVREKERKGVWIWGDYYPMVAVAGKVAYYRLTPETLMYWPLFGTEVLKAAQPGRPPLSMEFQGGWSTRPPFVKASDTRMLSYYAIAHGLKGLNFFMFADGTNPEGYELTWHTGRSYDFSAALNEDGEPTERYFALQRIGRFLREGGERLANAHKLADIALAYYLPYFQSPPRSKSYGLRFDARQLIEKEYFGLMRLMNMSGVNFELLDVESAGMNRLTRYKAVMLLSLDYMDRETQEKLVGYVERGGSLIVYPSVPWLDEAMEKCDIMGGLFNAPVRDTLEQELQQVTVGDMPALALSGTDEFDVEALDVQPIAYDSKGATCGYITRRGKGLGILLGATFAAWTMDEKLADCMTETQKEASKGVILYLLGQAGARRHAYASDLDVEVVEQVANDDTYGFVFVMNTHSSSRAVTLHVTDPGSRKETVFPRMTELSIPPMMCYALVLNTPIAGQRARIRYCTSEIHGLRLEGLEIVIEIWADKVGEGELALEMREKPRGVFVDEEPARFVWDEQQKTLILVYDQGEHLIRIRPKSFTRAAP